MRTKVKEVKETEDDDDILPELGSSVTVMPPPVMVRPKLVVTSVVVGADCAVVGALDTLVVGFAVALDCQHLEAEQISPASQ